MLQHGSIILVPQIETLVSLWPGSADSPAELRAKLEGRIISLQEILGQLPEMEEVKVAIREGMSQALGLRFDPGELTPDEIALAQDMANHEDKKNPCPTRTLPKSPSAGSGSALPA
jgi:lipoate-protein ligase A